jgi:Ca2+-binding RTX toxin-like protein
VPVSASSRPVGAETLGGRWELDEDGGLTVLPPLTARGIAGYASLLATYNATTGQDNFTGDSANDTVAVTDTSQIQSSDVFNAGAGTDAIQVGSSSLTPVTVDLSAAGTDGIHGFLGFEALKFLNLSGTSSATFSSAQFGTGLIAPTLAVSGVAGGTQKVTVNMAQAETFNVSGWTFTSWTAGTDSLTINGSSGNDTIVLGASSPVSATDTYNGGAGTDTIQVGATSNSGSSINFSAAAANGTAGLVSIEGLKFANKTQVSTATFSAAQFGNGLVSNNLAVTGTSSRQAVVVNLSGGGSLNLSGWTFSGWSSGTDTITVNGSTGAETITGSSQIDILAGGAGADTLTGGSGLDTFKFTVGDSALTVSGTGTSGTISGYDVITDFKAGTSTATSEKISISRAAVPANTTGTNGTDSTLQLHTNAAVASHAITSGIVSFSTSNTFAGAVALTSLSDVAAAVQYLRNQDFGRDGASLAFTATLAGVTHTFVYIQGGNSANTANDLLIDLPNVSATAISASSGKLSVLDTVAPAAPSSVSIPENAGGGINASEASDGTIVAVSLAGTGAIAGDTLTLNWGSQTLLRTLTASDILASSASMTVSTSTLSAQGDGTFDVTAKLTDSVGNSSANSAPVSVTVDRTSPSVTIDMADSALNVADPSSTVTFTFSEAPVGFALSDIATVGGAVSGLTATADPLIYTATFTAAAGFTGTGSLSLAAGSYTDAVLNAGAAGSDSVSIDQVSPTVTVDIAATSLDDGTTSSTVTFAFSEAPNGFTLSDIAAVGGTVSGLTATADPLVYTATFTADDGFSGTGSVSLAAGSYTDAAANAGNAGSDTVATDRTSPTVAVDIAASTLNDGAPTSTVTFTFSETPVGFAEGDVTAVGGTLSGFTATANPLVYTATFTANDGFNGTGSVSVASGSYSDAALNPGTAGSDTVTVDRANGGLTVNIIAGSLTDANPSSTVAFTFSEAPVGFTLDDITAIGGTISNFTVTVDPLVYTANFIADDGFTGTGTVSVAAGSYTDVALNPGEPGSDIVVIDRANPTIAVDIQSAALSDGEPSATVTFTFSDPPVGFTAADITALGGTVSGLRATGNPLVYTATFTATDGFAGTGSVSVAAGSYADAASNSGAAGSDTVTIDRARPTVTVDIAASTQSDTTSSSTVTFTFSEAPTGFTLGDITAVGGTVSGLAATANPLAYTATFTATDGFGGTGSVAVTAGSYSDAALNAGVAGSDTVAIDRVNPTVAVDLAAISLSDGTASSTVTFAFSEAPLGFGADDITAVGGAVSGLSATANPLVYTATFAATDGFAGPGCVSVAAGGYTDAALNAGGAGSDTVTIDRANPTVAVDILADAIDATDTSSVVTFAFSEPPVGFSLSDITAVGGTISGLSATSDPLIYTATFTGADGFNGTGSVSVVAGSYTDAALNAGSSGSDVVTVARANSGLTVDIVADSLNDSTSSSSVTFTFTLVPVGFTQSDIQAVGGTVSNLVATGNPLVYTATFTATDGFNGTGSVSVPAGSYTDAGLNPGQAGSDVVDIDRENPTVAVGIVDSTLSDSDSTSDVIFTFSEAPVDFALTDLAAVGGTVSNLTATDDPLVYTATFTATDGFSGTGSVSVAGGSFTDESLNVGGNGSDIVTIDRSNPTVTVDITDGTLNDGQASSTVTFTFSEAPLGLALGDITAVGGTVSGLAATADPLVYTATFTATDGFAGAGSVSLAAGSYTDVALNVGGGGSDSVTIDRTNPTVTVDIAAASLSDGTPSSTVTFTFSEAPVGFTLGDITAVSGTVSGLNATANPLVYTATFTATDSFAGTGSVSLAAGSYTNAALNAGGAGSDTVTIDRANPTVSVDIASGALCDGDASSDVTFTFSEVPVGFALSDIAAVGGTVSGLVATANPLVYTATFTAADGFSGTGSVSAAAGGYTDTASNAGGAGSDTVAIDRANPTVTVDIADSALNDGAPSSTVTFTFSEAPIGFALNDISAVGGTVSGLAATANPLVYTATFTATDGFAGAGSVSLAAGSYTDAALNAGDAGSDTVSIDRTNPTVAVDIADSALSDGTPSSTVTFTFSQAPLGFTLSDIAAAGGTVSGLTATADPLVYTATFTATDGFTGTGSVSVTTGSYTNAALNAGSGGSDTVTIDRTNPTVLVDIAAGSLDDADNSSTVTFTFSEAPVGFALSDITAVGGTVSSLAATANPLIYTATFTATDGFGGTGSVSVAAGRYTDAALNAGGAGSATVAIDRTNPTVTVDIADSALSDGQAGSTVTFTFSEAPVGFSLGGIATVGGTVSALAATANPLVYTATFTATDGFTGTGSVSVAAGGYTDAALNAGDAGSDTVSIDRTNPTVAVDIAASVLSDGSPGSTVTFTFSEAPAGFALNDITAVGGTVSDLATTGNPLVYTAAFMATDGFSGTGSVSVAAGSYTDAALNAGGAGSDTVAIDRANPTVAVTIADSALSDADSSSTVTFAFSEAPVGFELSDIAAVGGTVTDLAATANPLVYTATFTADDNFSGTGSVSVAAGSYTDAASNPGSAASATVAVDRKNPTLTIDIANASLSDSDPSSTVTFSFSEEPVGFALSDIAAVGGALSDLTATSDPLVYTATFTATDGFAGTGSVAVAAGSYTDAASNAGEAASSTPAIDRSNPTVRVNIIATTLSDTTNSSTVIFSFSEAPAGFALNDIAAVGGTVSNLAATANPLIYTATFTATDGFSGTGSVAVAAGSYTDAASNTGGAGSDTVSIDREDPTVAVGIADSALSDGNASSTVTFSFSEAPVGFELSDIAAVGGTMSDLTATANPLVYSATFTAEDGLTGTGSVSVAPAAYTDSASNAGGPGSATVAIDRTNPTVTVDIVETTLNDGTPSSTVTFSFSEAPVGFDLSDITAAGGSVSDLAATANPLVYTATFAADDGFAGTGSVAAGGYADAAGNPGETGSDSVAIDRSNAGLTVDIVDGALSDAEPSSTVTFTFSQVPIGFTLEDITAVGGTVNGLTVSADPLVYTATFTATDGFSGIGSVAVAAGSYTNASHNPGEPASDAVTIDRDNPTVAVDIESGTLNDGDPSSQVMFTFSQAPVGFDPSDITAVGGTVSDLAVTSDPLVYTATFTATDGFTGSGSVSVAADSYTDAAANPGGAGSDTVAIDRTNPAVTVDIAAADLSDGAPSSTVTLSFSEMPVGFDLGDITAVGGTMSALAVTSDPLVYTATFTARNAFSGTGSVSVAAGSYTDQALNPGSADSDTVTIDRANPTMTVDIADGALSDGTPSSTVTFTFSEEPVGFAVDDIAAVGGAVSDLSATSNPLVYTATFTATNGFVGTGSVSVPAGDYTDAALNPGGAGSDTVAIDRTNPTAAVNIADAALSDGDPSSTVTFSFSQAPVGFAPGDVTAIGGTVSDLSATSNPLVYTATFTAADGFASTGSVSVAAGSYTNAAHNPGAAGSTTVAVDRENPTVAVDIPAGALNDSSPSTTVTLTFSEAPIGFALDDIAAVGGTVRDLAATGNPLVYTATLTAAAGFSGTGSVSVTAGSYSDAALNAGGAASDSVAIDRAAPTVAVDIANSALSDGDTSSTVTFTFSEAPVGFTLDDIAATGGTVSDLAPTSDSLVYTATFTATDGFSGTGSVSVTAGDYTDAAGNAGAAGSDTLAIDRENPTLTVDVASSALNDGDAGSTVTFAFSEVPIGFTLGDIAAIGGTVSDLSAASNPLVYTATFTAADGFTGTGSVAVKAGSYTDDSSNVGAAGSDTVAIDRENPTVAVDIAGNTLSNGNPSSTVTFTFSEAPAGFTLADIAAVGGAVSHLAATGNPLVYTATFTADAGFSGTGSVAVTAGSYTDTALNVGGAGSATVTIDREDPTVAVDIADVALSDDNTSSTVTFTFSEAPVGFALDDISAVGGTLSALTASINPLVYTAVFTATDGFSDTGSVSVTADSYTDAASNAGGAGSDTVPIDRANPKVMIDIAAGTLNDGDPSSTVTFTFSESPVDFALDDIDAVGGTVSGLAATGDPLVYTATFSATDGFSGSGSVSLAAGSYTDASLNAGAAGSDAVTIDRANPTVAVDIADNTLNDGNPSSTVTFTFSEAPVGFALEDITTVGGTLNGLSVTASPLVYTATFTADDGFTGTGAVSVQSGSYTDLALNPGASGSSTVSIDRTNPTVTVDVADSALSDGDASSTVSFTFSQAPVGFTPGDIAATGGTVSNLVATGDSLVYTATFTADDDFNGSGSVAVKARSYTNARGNAGSAGSDTVTIDRQNPTVEVAIAGGTLSDNTSTATVTFAFSEAPVGFALSDITAVGGTASDLAATSNPLVYAATFTADDGFAGTGAVSVTAGSYTDVSLNAGGAGSASATIDRENPMVTVDIVDGELSDGLASSTVTFTFSEEPVGFTLDDVTAVGGTVTGLAATGNPLVYTATFTAAQGFAGTGSVSVTADSYADTASNAGGANTDTVTIDRSADVDGNLTLSIADTAINAAERMNVAFTTSGIDADVVTATVTFTDTAGHTVTVEASAGVADLSSLDSGTVAAVLDVIDASGNKASVAGAPIDLDKVNGSEGDDVIVGTTVADTFNGLGGNDMITGLAGNDALNGGDGNDTLDGGTGNDTLTGGAGNDQYYVDSAIDRVIEAIDGGADTVYAGVNYALAAGQEVESLLADAGASGLTLTGNEFNNTLIGADGDDTLNGGNGNDTLSAGNGNDALNGGAGNDQLNGGSGDDKSVGGVGNDRYYVDSVADQVVEAAGGGNDLVFASVDYSLADGHRVESLRANAGATGLILTGNEFNNALVGGAGSDTVNGGAGDDILNGGAGNDALAGGSGNDRYMVDSPEDHVIEAIGGGADLIFARVSYTLAAGEEVESLWAAAGATGLTLTGNEFDNSLVGAIGSDI